MFMRFSRSVAVAACSGFLDAPRASGVFERSAERSSIAMAARRAPSPSPSSACTIWAGDISVHHHCVRSGKDKVEIAGSSPAKGAAFANGIALTARCSSAVRKAKARTSSCPCRNAHPDFGIFNIFLNATERIWFGPRGVQSLDPWVVNYSAVDGAPSESLS